MQTIGMLWDVEVAIVFDSQIAECTERGRFIYKHCSGIVLRMMDPHIRIVSLNRS